MESVHTSMHLLISLCEWDCRVLFFSLLINLTQIRFVYTLVSAIVTYIAVLHFVTSDLPSVI